MKWCAVSHKLSIIPSINMLVVYWNHLVYHSIFPNLLQSTWLLMDGFFTMWIDREKIPHKNLICIIIRIGFNFGVWLHIDGHIVSNFCCFLIPTWMELMLCMTMHVTSYFVSREKNTVVMNFFSLQWLYIQ